MSTSNRVALVGRIPGGPRPRGTLNGPLSAAGARATVRWDDGLVSSVPTAHLVALPAPLATVWREDADNPAPAGSQPPLVIGTWWVDCERDGQYLGSASFATEAEAVAYSVRWF